MTHEAIVGSLNRRRVRLLWSGELPTAMITLSRRFSRAFLLLVALPSLVVSIILSRLYLSALYNTVELQSQATAEQVAQNVRAETETTAVLAAALFHDGELRRLIEGYAQATGATERFVWTRSLDEKLVSFFTYSNRIGEVVFYLQPGHIYRYSNDPRLRAADTVDRSELAGAATDPGKVYLLDTLDVAQRGELHMLSIAVCPVPGDPIAAEAMLLRFRAPALDALAAGGGDGGPDVVMLGRSGRPILSSLPAAALVEELAAVATRSGSGGDRSSFRTLRTGGRSWLATLRPMESTGWTLLLLADEAALSQRVTRYGWYLYPAIALLAALFIAYANRMVEETDRLQAERERTERERLTAELEALRHQINPHFIANTLNSIRLMASAARADAIVGMTRDLMRMLSDSYAGAGMLTELSREIAGIAAYVGIMKVRFGERFRLEIDTQRGTESLLVPRMILQPIVENAILHGFGGSAGSPLASAAPGTIRITARCESRVVPRPPCPEPWAAALPDQVLLIEVHDDGTGMSPRDAGASDDPGAAGSGPERLRPGIGIANVQRRIALNFGAPYDLAIESVPGAFTRVRYLLPALARVEGSGEADDV
jgi:two-component system sensor histidine kinase YesM